ncbi:serine/threonine protein kinase [Streptomyces sp. NA04227]|uniref:serine/threonine-protein kinase n=1 Tax=Streptomyces sp. NA04227 TaxID=2742136 RepID=UPI00158FB143|nr:serine/threonine-protein kinase [Streptomyces sp. NA04227]QKW11078.1 serine/threonine protein kinase [Streptomyces sp. NA04227]
MQGLLLGGRYRLGESIGRGGMGRVWRAHDELLHRAVAVKELTAAQYAAEADRAVLLIRTQTEARAAARINHPAVVTVHDVLEHDERPWIVMELVDGPSLADTVKAEGSVDPVRAARIGLWVLRALRAAHTAGVLHRDVKPGNVLLARDGRVLLTDFGIAQVEGDTTITRTGEIVGSVDYLAPERVRGAEPGPASDLWALGATLFTAVEGRSPFRRTTPLNTMQAVVDEEVEPTEVSGSLGPVISALLRKDPAQRPDSEEAEQMLAEAADGRRPVAAQMYVPTQSTSIRRESATLHGPPPAPVTAAPEPRRRRGWRTALAVLVAAALIGGGTAVGLRLLDAKEGGGADNSASSEPTGPKEGEIPADWRRVHDVKGFSMAVPPGYERQTDGTQVDYTADDGNHFIRIGVDETPDFDNAYLHQLDLERSTSGLTDYRRLRLTPNSFGGGEGSLWEFTWTAAKERPYPGPRRVIEETYIAENGVEYAIYMSSPAKDWATTRKQFDAVLASWRVSPPS